LPTPVPSDLIISVRSDLPRGLKATTDGRRTIWLAEGLSSVEAKCAIYHELVHIKHGHAQRQPAWVERQVREETARALIGLHDLHWAWKRSRSIYEMADELRVTETVLTDRLDTLTHNEAHTLTMWASPLLETIGA
jgi:hypothetical protein